MSAGSWQAFADALCDENRCLGELGAAALAMTSVLVRGTAPEITAAERDVEAKLVLHEEAQLRRTQMMKGGFGDLTLGQVCNYAPGTLKRSLFLSLRDLRVRGIGLRITIGNNKALITAGLRRIAKTLEVMQNNSPEPNDGTYRRRGIVAPSSSSLIVSRKA